MIIVDFSQICVASFMQAVGQFTNTDVDIETFRHMTLNSLRAINMKFRNEYHGRLVLAVDSSPSWRKKIFPYYKANRKDSRKASDIDWSKLYAHIATLVDEIDQHMPYQVFKVKYAEADDIVGVLARLATERFEKSIIVSGDKDFVQLQIDAGNTISQYDNVRDRYHKPDDPARYLFEHVMKGDRGDGIPNVLSPENALVSDVRQKPIRQKFLDECWENGYPEGIKERVKQNIRLIDLRKTPEPIKEQVLSEYAAFAPKKVNTLQYFIDKGLEKLCTKLGDYK